MVQSPLNNRNLISDPDVPGQAERPLELRTEPPEGILEEAWGYDDTADVRLFKYVDEIAPSNFELVKDWHAAFGITDPDKPVMRPDRAALRLDLIEEEYSEIVQALDNDDIVNLAKELADLLWVTYGMAAEYGIDVDRVFKAVYESNMSKLGEDGKPVLRADGKILKSKSYKEADLSWIGETK